MLNGRLARPVLRETSSRLRMHEATRVEGLCPLGVSPLTPASRHVEPTMNEVTLWKRTE
jgi:hypothetical protein